MPYVSKEDIALAREMDLLTYQEFMSLALSTDHDLTVVDPEREYGPLVRALGGEVITISASNGENSYRSIMRRGICITAYRICDKDR